MKTLTKESFFQKHRYAVFFFSFVVLYNFLITNRCRFWQADLITHTYHLVDFSVGFCTRLLPGAIYYGLFGEKASMNLTTVYETVLLLVFFAVLAFTLEKLLNRVNEKQRGLVFFILILYLSGPCTFAMFTDELGMLDVYWVFCSLAFFFCVESKIARWFIPVICVLTLLIHYSSMIAYIVMFFIVMLYKIGTEEKKKPWMIIFAISLFVTVLTFLYFLTRESSNLHFTMQQFNDFLKRRGSEYYAYYDMVFYDYYYEDISVAADAPKGFFGSIFALILNQIVFSIGLANENPLTYYGIFVYCLLTVFPVVVLIFLNLKVWIKSSDGNRVKRLALSLLFVQFPFTIIFGVLDSIDTGRWISHAFIVLFTIFLYLLYAEGAQLQEQLKGFHYKNPLFCIWAFVYFFTWFKTYS